MCSQSSLFNGCGFHYHRAMCTYKNLTCKGGKTPRFCGYLSKSHHALTRVYIRTQMHSVGRERHGRHFFQRVRSLWVSVCVFRYLRITTNGNRFACFDRNKNNWSETRAVLAKCIKVKQKQLFLLGINNDFTDLGFVEEFSFVWGKG